MSRLLEIILSGSIFIKAKIFMFIFGFFSVDNKKILFSNFNGKGYGENPRAVCDELLKRKTNMKLYWIVDDINDKSIPKSVIKIKNNSIKYYYHLRTSKVWINNVRFRSSITKRDNQFYIQLWHGPIGLKKIEKDCEEHLNKYYVKAAKNDSKYIDLMVSNSKHFTNLANNSFWYKGRVEKFGTPKNDEIVNTKNHNEIIDIIRKKYNIKKEEKILLYAPTFRTNYSSKTYDINLEQLIDELKKIYNCNYKVLVRLHPNSSESYISKLINNKNIINVNSYPNINHLLIASDILITDYSSIMFDIALLNKKVFIYASDIDEYDREFYFDIYKLPFDVSKNMNELINNIKNFDEKKYIKKIDKFNIEQEIFEDGHASERVANEILKVVGEDIEK